MWRSEKTTVSNACDPVMCTDVRRLGWAGNVLEERRPLALANKDLVLLRDERVKLSC